MNDIREVLAKALDSERRTYDIYRKAAGQADSPEVRTLFDVLARDELRHQKTLESELKLLDEQPESFAKRAAARQRSSELDVFMYGAKAARRPAGTERREGPDAEMARELAIAAEVQANLLPKTLPEIPGIELAGFSVPARQVGGDYYDAIYNPATETLGLVIGDVMGKGFGAALLMANVRAAWRANYVHGLSSDWILDTVNRSMYLDFSDNTSFVTLFTGTFSVSSGVLNYSSAGHNPPLLLRAGAEAAIEVGSPGIVIGIDPRAIYLPQSVSISSGDLLFMYTDGLLDVWGRDMDVAVDAISNALVKNRDLPAQELLDQLTRPVARKQSSLTDDVSCLVMKLVAAP